MIRITAYLLAAVWAIFHLFGLGRDVAAVQTASATPTPAGGFRLLDSAPAVGLYRKDYSNGTPDFLQVVDLGQGASIKLLHGAIIEPRLGKGHYGGDDPRFAYQSLAVFWRVARDLDSNLFCVSNGLFFYMKENPTRLAFPLKVGGEVLTDGWAYATYPGQQLMLEIWADRVDIRSLTEESLYDSNAPDIIAGLTEEANKQAKFAVARTFVGIDDRDGDGQYETLLVLNTRTAVQAHMADVLRSLGAEKVMMLDGGGSTQLTCRGGPVIESERLIPQAVAIYAAGKSQATPPPITAEPLATPTPIRKFPEASGLAGSQVLVKLQATESESPPAVNPGDVLIIPLIIIPVALVVVLVVRLRK